MLRPATAALRCAAMETVETKGAEAMARLLEIMRRLRDPEHGCPWDVEQDFASIAPHTIEEAHEVAEAIAQGDMEQLRGELGDLLFQVVFHAQMARERDAFAFADVVAAISDKMIARHPNVFGELAIDGARAQSRAWESHKADERARLAARAGRRASVLDGLALALPALLRALKLQARAARVGFDWAEAAPIIDKIAEECAEFVALQGEADAGLDRRLEEFGDLLFSIVNLARHLDLDPEEALRRANRKFERRFRAVEERFAEAGRELARANLDEMEAAWRAVKRAEREPPA